MAEITELLQEKGIPCVPVNTPMGFANDEHVQGRGFMTPVEHAGFGSAKQPAMPFMIDGSRPAVGSVPLLDSWRDDGAKRSAPQQPRSTGTSGNGPLDGMRIVSFDHVLAGPYGTTILAELGADVIKVESSKGGMDPFRFFGTGEDPNLSPRFLEFNRNKRSFTVNLKHPKGQGVLHDLVAKADAVLDNYSVDVVERIGLGYKQLCAVKPDIINLRMPGLGTTGPKRHFSTVGVNITAFTGLDLYVESSGRHQSADRCAAGFSGLCFRRAVRDHHHFRRALSRPAKEGRVHRLGAVRSDGIHDRRQSDGSGVERQESRAHRQYVALGGAAWLLSVQGRRSLVRDRRGNRGAMVGAGQDSRR